MSIAGDLQHFPIIDVIQLLHGTRNSGVLRLASEKGESQLVFHNGDLVSANYLNNRVRIGQVLVSAGAITDDQLTQALEIQKSSGSNRKPLVLTLLEHDMIDENAAYSGIEALIEMTIVEVLTWKTGRFALDMATSETDSGHQFSPTKYQQQILLNAQGILLESLRIFDEKMRDGTMDGILSIAGVTNSDLDNGLSDNNLTNLGMTAATQGKADFIASSLKQIAEQRAKIQTGADRRYRDPAEVKRLVSTEFPSAPSALKQQIAKILAGTAQPAADTDDTSSGTPGLAVVVITKSPLLSTMIKAVCHQENIYVVSADDRAAIDISIRLLQCQDLHPVIMLDLPHSAGPAEALDVYQDYLIYQHVSIVLIACPKAWGSISLQALGDGVRSVVPKPCKECSEETYGQQALLFCTDLGKVLCTYAPEIGRKAEHRFFECISRLRTCKTRTEIAEAVLMFLAETFERAIVFNVAAPNLIAELSFGIRSEKKNGPTEKLNVKIPLDDQPIYQEVLVTGQLFYGFHSDSSYQHWLYREIGQPECPEVLLFPLVRANRVIAIIYADFGSKTVSAPTLNFLEALVQYTTAQISVSAYRQKLKSMLEESSRL